MQALPQNDRVRCSCYRRMNKQHVRMERLMEKDTLHALYEKVSLPYWCTVDKTRASVISHQSVTLIYGVAKVV